MSSVQIMITPVKVPETPIILTRPGQDQDGQDAQEKDKDEVTIATEAASPHEPLMSEVRSPASARSEARLSCDPAITDPADTVPVATLVTTA